MRFALLLAGSLFLSLSNVVNAQWTFNHVFPDTSGGKASPLTNTAHGLAVDGEGKVWVGPYVSEVVPFTYPEGVTSVTSRQNRVRVFHPDGTEASFSPLYASDLGDSLLRFGPITGMTNDQFGNVYIATHGYRVPTVLTSSTIDDGGTWRTDRSFIHKYAPNGTLLKIYDVTEVRIAATTTSLQVTHAPNSPGVTSEGHIVVSFVFGGTPIRIYHAETGAVLNTVTSNKRGFSRSMAISPDGRRVFSPNSLDGGRIDEWVSSSGVTGEYHRDTTRTIGLGMQAGAVLYHPSGLLYATASGIGNNPDALAPWNSSRTYGLSIETAEVIDSLTWNYGTTNTFAIPRSLALSRDGRSIYWGTFSVNIPAVQKFTFQGELPEPPPTIDLQSGLVAYYPFNGNAEDESGNGHHGIVNNGTSLSADRFRYKDSAYMVDGVQWSTERGIRVESNILNTGQESYSISIWILIKNAQQQAQTFFDLIPHASLALGYNHPFLNDTKIAFYVGDGENGWYGTPQRPYQFTSDRNNYFQDVWYQTVIVKKGNEFKLFIDGLIDHAISIPDNINIPNITEWNKDVGIRFGSCCGHSSNEPLNGSFDDIRIYNRALSDAEVAALYELESTPPPLATNEIQDIDGNRYTTVRIGDQVWMAENLRTTRYQDGSLIPNVTDGGQWSQLSTGAWANYNNDPAIGEIYGKLYNWYAAADQRNVCPVGWHVPSDEEWTVLSEFLGEDAGFKMKSTLGWDNNGNGSNGSGFTGLPSGLRNSDGSFPNVGRFGNYWSTSVHNSDHVWGRNLAYDGRDLSRYDYGKTGGLSIRCVRPYSSQTASSDNWNLPIRASSSIGLFASATLGVNPAASNGLDSLDVPAPPTAPGESISLYTNHPEWNWILGSRVAGDIRASVDLSAVPNTWELILSSTGASNGELTLDRPEGLKWPIVVMNGANRWLSRSGDLVVPFTFAAAGNQTFTVHVGDTTAPELQAGAWFEGPAILDASATHPLDWQASDLNHLQSVELEVSHDDGSTWKNVYAGTGASFNWTPSGNIVFNESTRFSLTATDRAGNWVSQTTMSPISVMAPRQAVNWPQGWSIRGSAYAPTNQTNSVMGDAFRYSWNGAGYEQVSGFETGHALWVGSTIAGTDTLAGTVAGQGQILQLPAGWNMITAPLLRTVYGDSIRVMHSGNGRSLWLAEAIDSMWVTAPLAYVNNAYAAANRMTPFSGYWMGVLAPGVSLEMPIHAYSTVVSKESTQEEPIVRLLLQDGAAEQVLSVKQGSGVPAPPAAPNAERVGLRGLPTILGELYLVAGAKVDAPSTHPLVIGGSPRDVTLSWTDQSFAGMTAVLQLTDRRYDLTRANSISLRSDVSAQVIVGPISTSTEPGSETPLRTELMAAYPNPFNPSTVVGYQLSVAGSARLTVYDLLGRQVAVLVNGTMPAGRHQVTFDAAGLASGVYLVRLEAGGEVFTRRVTLLK